MSEVAQHNEMILVPPGAQTGVYHIVVSNLSFRTTWQSLKDFVREACEPDHVEVYRPTGAWIRVKGFDTFKKAWTRLNGGSLDGYVLFADARNALNPTLIVKAKSTAPAACRAGSGHQPFSCDALSEFDDSGYGSMQGDEASSLTPPVIAPCNLTELVANIYQSRPLQSQPNNGFELHSQMSDYSGCLEPELSSLGFDGLAQRQPRSPFGPPTDPHQGTFDEIRETLGFPEVMPCQIFVDHLGPGVSEQEVRKLLQAFISPLDILDVEIPMVQLEDYTMPDGVAYITFSSAGSADDAIALLNGLMMGNELIEAGRCSPLPAKGKSRTRTGGKDKASKSGHVVTALMASEVVHSKERRHHHHHHHQHHHHHHKRR